MVCNAVLESLSECPGDQIVDCDLDAWVGKQCTVECDDSCPEIPDASEVSCGRWQEIYRKVVVAPDAGGLSCPDLSRTKKCNQKKCPVDCIMSEWEEFGLTQLAHQTQEWRSFMQHQCGDRGLQQNVMRP